MSIPICKECGNYTINPLVAQSIPRSACRNPDAAAYKNRLGGDYKEEKRVAMDSSAGDNFIQSDSRELFAAVLRLSQAPYCYLICQT